MKKLIKRYKNYQKRKFIISKNNKKYAFVGIGTHSIYNLYPIINFFRLDIKYIVTKSPSNAKLINEHFPHSIGTSDFDLVLNDSEISGVFIATTPLAHFSLVKRALIANKNVFVEKPPCLSLEELDELIEIEKNSEGTCMVGLQKQYAPSNLKLKQKIKKNHSYNYRFVTGAYPEGDPLIDLFIHPISLVNFLFGEIENQNFMLHKTNGNITVIMQLQHENNTIGNVELSTNYSWQNPVEHLILNAPDGIYENVNTEQLTFEPKTKTLFGIPMEKVIKRPNKSLSIEKRTNSVPIIFNNQLYSSGYYNEMETFINICESRKTINNTTISSCKSSFSIILQLKKTFNVQ